jgi:hypothetical protein
MKNIGNRTEFLEWSENLLDVKPAIKPNEQLAAEQSNDVRVFAFNPRTQISLVPEEEIAIAFVPKPGIYLIVFSIASSPATMNELNLDNGSIGEDATISDILWSSQTMVVVQ